MTRLIDVDALHLVCNVYDSDAKRIIWEINHAPTVDAVPVRHGRWRPVQIGKWYGFECTACKVNREVPCSNKSIPQWKYCPECGARMDEDE